MSDADKVINNIVAKIVDYQPERVIVFGSSIRGKWQENSDIDLAIIKKTSQPFYKRAAEVRKLLRSKIPLDVFVFTPEEYESAKKTNPLVSEIERTGRVVYGPA